MRGKRPRRCVRNIPHLLVAATVCTGLLAYWDAYEWFYTVSRQHEAYNYDEIVIFLTLFLIVGLLWNFRGLYQEAIDEISNRRKAEAELSRLNLELDQRVDQRTAELRRQLDKRKQAEKRLVQHQQRLRALSAELALAQERERHRVSVDLHDNIGQTLALANNKLVLLEAALTSETDRRQLHQVRALVKESIRYSRSLVAELDSPLFHDISFLSATEWMADDILEKNGIAHHIKADSNLPDLPDSARILLFKAIREILVNIVKHAGAHHVEIAFRSETDNLKVEIRDDGVGFDTQSLPRTVRGGRQGFGVLIVRERLTYLNGDYKINSAPGAGTCVTLSLPPLPGKQASEVAAWR